MRPEMNLPKVAYVRTFIAQWPASTVDWCDAARVTIDIIPDVALLEIFDFCVNEEEQNLHEDESQILAWRTLVHVCRKWRNIVFGSPRRLGIRLCYKAILPLKETLGIWPPLPIAIWANTRKCWYDDNHIIAAFNSEHKDRICGIELWDFPSWQLEKVSAAMNQPFPALTFLVLGRGDETLPDIPASFLGGSAPHLQTLILDHIPFPGLPILLLSATHLVKLCLWGIPHSGYISPEVMVNCLSALTRLETLNFKFESPQSSVDRNSRHSPPPTLTLLPALTKLCFRGLCEYLEDFVALIDAPLLDMLEITLFHELIINTPRLTQFISRVPNFKAHDKAHVESYYPTQEVWVALRREFNKVLKLGISYNESDLQLSSLARVCSSSFPQGLIPAVEHLYVILDERWDWQDVVDNSQWLELLHLFTSVKSLYISQDIAPHIAPALQELVGESVTEVLPALETIYLHGTPLEPVQEIIGQFVDARQLTSRPVAVSHWNGYYYFED